jgi:hypothetical protein
MRRSVVACTLFWLASAPALAQDGAARRVELRFTPVARAQMALWIESGDGARFATVRLTASVSVQGIGNRPGATQMNSGFRWPYGRREGVLPVWGYRRIERGGEPFRRVIFNNRRSEGDASSASTPSEPRNTRDDYFCLSFNRELSGRDALDAVSCASVFNSNKGRYMLEEDVANGYAEPWQEDGAGVMRAMPSWSLYPPRRDVAACSSDYCGDHADVHRYAWDARLAMPDIDAVTMATPAGDVAQRIVFDIPSSWPEGVYVAYLEINVEGDYNEHYDATVNPTPTAPSGMWDYWAINYGYPYRGQPSVVFRVPFRLEPGGGAWDVAEPFGYGALHGESDVIAEMDGTITDDPDVAAGSGADRLGLDRFGRRFRVVVPGWNICEQPDPPEACGRGCTPGDDTCSEELICGPELECVGRCDVSMAPGGVEDFTVLPHTDEKQSHRYAHLSFRVPDSVRGISRYEVRVGTEPIVDAESFERALPAVQAAIDRIELTVPADGQVGDLVELDFGGLTPQTTYYVGMRAFDECNAPSSIATAEVTTTEIHFTTVSPCFVATAAYGSPLEPRVAALRRFRDRHLRTNVLGRAFVSLYETVGPHAADAIRDDDTLRSAVRFALEPIVALAEALD